MIDNTATTLYPGGFLNTGFALQWAQDRVDDSKPASATEGQGWAYKRIQEGDQICKANQTLHTAAADLISKVHRNRVYRPKVANPLNPSTFVSKINVPTFMACQFEDEQTGGHCANLADRFTGTKRKWFTFDQRLPHRLARSRDLQPLVRLPRALRGGARPQLSPLLKASASVIYQTAMGINGVTLPPDPIQDQPTYDAALAAFQAQPQVKVMFDNGAGGAPGVPYPGFERDFSRFPIPRHAGSLLVLRAERDAHRQGAEEGRQPELHLGQVGEARHTTSPARTPAVVTSGPTTRASTGASRRREPPRRT